MPEHTIAENLQRLKAAKTAIGSAITAKGGTVGANDGLEEFAADIATIPSGGGTVSAPMKDVNFIDYDGTILYSYTAAEFANLSEMPANPSHEGLTAQGWNWSLADAKTYVASYGKLDIGQMYITSDSKTRLYISLPEGRTSPILQLYLKDNSKLDIDWGDGSTHSTFITATAAYKNERHEYSTSGDYVIAITVENGKCVLQSSSSDISSILWNGNNNKNSPDRVYNAAIKKIEIGYGVEGIDSNAFKCCYSLSSVTIPNRVLSIGSGAFYYCYSLTSVVIPNTVTGIGTGAFCYCTAISSISIPDSVTSFDGGAFQSCFSLPSITIPDSITSIGNTAFYNCYALSFVTIPDSITSIGSTAFALCYSLSSVTIPDSVTSISTQAFQNCSYMSYIKFKSTTPPTVANSNVWQNLSTSTKILVPTGTLETYKTATNYPNPSTYTYEEY